MSNFSTDLAEIIEHLEANAEIVEGRVKLFKKMYNRWLPRKVQSEYAIVASSCNSLVRAVALLRPLMESEKIKTTASG